MFGWLRPWALSKIGLFVIGTKQLQQQFVVVDSLQVLPAKSCKKINQEMERPALARHTHTTYNNMQTRQLLFE